MKNLTEQQKARLEELREIIYQREQSLYDDHTPDWLTEYFHDYWNDNDSIIENFIRNYRPSNVHMIINFDSNYESDDAKFIVETIGSDRVADLIKKNIFTSSDNDIYREHWNDIASDNWSEYETQVDRDNDDPILKEYFDLINSDHDWFYVDLGMVRAKLDVENFDKTISKILRLKKNLAA
jgi:hypothetical protein|tara:strand:- start:23513 stop:24055 length:543 start_codon:yes stop_codon:yes gene_type:complete